MWVRIRAQPTAPRLPCGHSRLLLHVCPSWQRMTCRYRAAHGRSEPVCLVTPFHYTPPHLLCAAIWRNRAPASRRGRAARVSGVSSAHRTRTSLALCGRPAGERSPRRPAGERSPRRPAGERSPRRPAGGRKGACVVMGRLLPERMSRRPCSALRTGCLGHGTGAPGRRPHVWSPAQEWACALSLSL